MQGWILSSQKFADRLRSLLLDRDEQPEIPRDSRLRCLDVSSIFLAVADHYGERPKALGERSRHIEMRSVAAWLAECYSPATLLGLGRAQSVGNLTHRVDQALGRSEELRRTIETIETRLAGTCDAHRRQKKKK